MSSASRAVVICGALATLVLSASSALAQATPLDRSLPSVPLGAHLRVRGQGPHSAVFTGRLRAAISDSLALALDDDSTTTVPFAVADLGRIEVQQDEKSRDQATAAMGVIGAAGGLTTALLWCKHNQDACADDVEQMRYAAENDSTYIGPTLLMILGGAVIGAGLGYVLAPPPHWELIAYPTRTSNNDGSPRLLLNVGLRYSLGGRRRR